MSVYRKPRTARSFQAMKNNAQGHFFEGYINGACAYYRDTGRAIVEKIPEPFKTTSTGRDGTFTGRFIANAQPDFMGTLRGGQAICFEAKYTSTDRILQSVITKTQWDSLERHWAAGAKAGVCVGIGDVFGFVPWGTWRRMKENYGRKYMTADDLKAYQVKFNGHCLFLDYINAMKREDVASMANQYELETKLEAVLGAETAEKIIEIIRGEDEDKQEDLLETIVEAAICGADYTECETIEDIAYIYARWFTSRYGN